MLRDAQGLYYRVILPGRRTYACRVGHRGPVRSLSCADGALSDRGACGAENRVQRMVCGGRECCMVETGPAEVGRSRVVDVGYVFLYTPLSDEDKRSIRGRSRSYFGCCSILAFSYYAGIILSVLIHSTYHPVQVAIAFALRILNTSVTQSYRIFSDSYPRCLFSTPSALHPYHPLPFLIYTSTLSPSNTPPNFF